MLNEKQEAILLGMTLLGATPTGHAAWENVEDGEEAWFEMLSQDYIGRQNGLFSLTNKGIDAVTNILMKNARRRLQEST